MDFIILKVNGRDLSSASHQEILAVFKTASEPILVEVARRNSKSSTHKPNTKQPSDSMSDVSISVANGHSDSVNPYATTIISHPQCSYETPQLMSRSAHIISNDNTFGLSSSSHPQNNVPTGNGIDLNINGIFEEEEDEDDNEEEQVDIIKEEVLLRKMHPREIFGLTLSYSALAANDNSESEVYISAIESDSVASKQPGIRIGDQILQINNIDVHSKAQVVSLFRSCGLEVRMLLGRPTLLSRKTDLNGTKNKLFNCDLPVVEEVEYSSVYDDVGCCKNKSVQQPQQLDKDSGIGRGIDETAKTEESSECDSAPTSLRKYSQFSSLDSSQGRVDMQQISLLMHHLATEYNQLQRLLQRPTENSLPRIQALPPPTLSNTSSRVVPRMGTKLEPPQMKLVNVVTPAASGSNTSAYSTGIDSTRSSPMTMELGHTLNSPSLLSLKLDHIVPNGCQTNHHHDDNGIIPSSSRNNQTYYASSDQKSASSTSMNDLVEARVSLSNNPDNECHYYDVYDPATTTTFNDTSYEVLSQSGLHSPYIMMEHEYINVSMIKSDRNDSKMEWVVKKRPDGTRYITRRPIREKTLKDRAKKVIEERSGLTTEEDENGSDARMIKYLCKSEKRRTQDRPKEKKHKKREISSSLQSELPSSNSPYLSRSDVHSMNRLGTDHGNIDPHKLYNRATFVVGSTMF